MAESHENVTGVPKPPISALEYLIGWICVLPGEYYEASKMFDEVYDTTHIVRARGDKNSYDVGRIGNHRVVMNCPESGTNGQVHATRVACDMKSTFPAIRFVLLVGIGGGSPSKKDVRLGDVVFGTYVVPYMHIKQQDFGRVVTGPRGAPPPVLKTAVTRLGGRLQHGLNLQNTIEMVGPNRIQRPRKDDLYQPAYRHSDKCHCLQHDSHAHGEISIRSERTGDKVRMHDGVVGSADQVMKNAVYRDQYAAEFDIICFEMEAIGVMETTSCITIRGISDYSDGHKNDDWHKYAALSAAVSAKELLKIISPQSLADCPLDITQEELKRSVNGAMYQIERSMHQSPGPDKVYQAAERNHAMIMELYGLVQDLIVPKLHALTHETSSEDLQHPQQTRDEIAAMRVIQQNLGKSLEFVGNRVKKEARRRPNNDPMRENWKTLKRKVDESSRWAAEVSKITHQILASTASKSHRFFMMVGKKGNRTFQDAGHAIQDHSVYAIEQLKYLMELFKVRFRSHRKLSQQPQPGETDFDGSPKSPPTGRSHKDDDDDDLNGFSSLPPGNGGPSPSGGGSTGVLVDCSPYGTSHGCSTSASLPIYSMERTGSPAPTKRPPPPPPSRSSRSVDLRTSSPVPRAATRSHPTFPPPPPPPPAAPLHHFRAAPPPPLSPPPQLPLINFEHRTSEDGRSSLDTHSLSTQRSYESERNGPFTQARTRTSSPLRHSTWRRIAAADQSNLKPLDHNELHQAEPADGDDGSTLPVSALVNRFQGNGLIMGLPRAT